MFRQIAMFIILAVTFVASGLLAEDVKQVPKPLGFAFHRDQSVYIAAFHYEDNHRKYGADRTGIGDYLAAEQLERKQFENSGICKLGAKPSNAEYVIVVYVHDNDTEGIPLTP